MNVRAAIRVPITRLNHFNQPPVKRFSGAFSLRKTPMKIALWTVFALISAVWTGTVLVAAELTAWLATTMGSGQAGDVISNVGQWPVPPWLSLWLDPAWVQSLQAPWVELLGWFGQSGQALGSVVSWLIPLMWVAWGGIMLILLVFALAGHFLLGKFQKRHGLTHNPT